MNIDLTTEPLGQDKDGNDVYLKDIWPTNKEVADLVHQTVTREAFQSKYADVFKGDEKWHGVETTDSLTYDWPTSSTYVQNPPYFQGMGKEPGRDQRRDGRPRSGDSRRHGHHRPHLARRIVQGHHARRPVSDRPPGRAARLQLLRLAPRQPPGDDARHLRQHPHQERDAGRGRGRLYQRRPTARRRRSTTPRWPIRRRARRW